MALGWKDSCQVTLFAHSFLNPEYATPIHLSRLSAFLS